MLYIYTPRASTGARDLAEGILVKGTIARRTKGQRLRELAAGDAVVCWGSHFAAPAGIKVLNNTPAITKFEEAKKLAAAGVPTVQVSQTKPAGVATVPRAAFVEPVGEITRLTFTNDNIGRMQDEIAQQFANFRARRTREFNAYQAAAPRQIAETWLPRRNNHVGGSDLLERNLANPNFYSKKEDIVEEYRVHMLNGKSIRAGKKIQVRERDGHPITPHPWIRSFDAGWVIQYNDFNSTEAMREIAKKALKALGLNFGAVDIGKKADGSLIVFEVNRAPGVEGGTIEAYAKHIITWYNGREQ